MSSRPTAGPFPIVAWFQRRTKVQRRIGAALAALVVIFLISRVVAGMVIDFWWFDTVTDAKVWTTKTAAQVLLAISVLLLGGAAVVGSAWIALRTDPAPDNKPNRIVIAYRQRMGPAHAWLLMGLAVVVTARSAYAAMGRWRHWLLFLSGPGLDTSVPDVGWSLSYHLYRLPFLEMASNWARLTVLYGLGFAIVAYIGNGALKIPRGGRRSAPRAISHIAILAAIFALLQAFDYIFIRWPNNATARFGAFNGAGFTQVRFIIPSLWILALVAIVVAILTLWGVRSREWKPALIAFGLWGVLEILLIVAVPAFVNRFVVAPAEADRQLPYIANNLEATRAAYSLDSVTEVTRTVADGLVEPPAADLEPVLDSVPVFAEASLITPLQVLKGTTGTRITDVDLDRYTIDGQQDPILVAARNSNRTDLPEKGWVQEHLVYTHGDGVVAVPADSTSSDGRPDVDRFTGFLDGVRPELYFGENLRGWYVIVGTQRREVGDVEFAGESAIGLGSLWRRLALSLTVGEPEPLLSAELGPNARLLYRRDVLERLEYLAPFLSFDNDPYPVIADGRITWVVDGYTTSSAYPYSQFARNVGVADADLPPGVFNYFHASIKATVDGYDGSVHLYRTEIGGDDDPILDAWNAIFPGLIEPIAEMPDTIRSHLLYPKQMLSIQTTVLGRYHVSDPETLFNGSDRWAISVGTGNGVTRGEQNSTPGPSPSVSLFMPSTEPLGGHWVAIRPYGPGSASNPTSTRDVLAALAIADHDNPGELVLVRIEAESGRPASSPVVAQAAIDTDDDLAALFTLLNANGSTVQFGPMTPIPLEESLIWARSIIVNGVGENTAPSLYGVAAVSYGLVGQADTTADAVTAAIDSSG